MTAFDQSDLHPDERTQSPAEPDDEFDLLATATLDEPEVIQREAIAERVAAANATVEQTEWQPAPSAEQYLRDVHASTVTRLAELRSQRDGVNELIRLAVAEEELLRRAVAVFDRARAV